MAKDRERGDAAVEISDLEALFRERYIEGSNYHKDFHDDATEDFAMYAGHQYEKDEEDYADKRAYPLLTLNQIMSIINAVSSTEITNRFEPKFLPRSPEDQDVSDKITAVARYIRQQAGAESIDSDVFRDALTCGVGIGDWYFDETIGKTGQICTTTVPIEEVIWDPTARKQNLRDARWFIRGLWMDVDEYSVLFPDADLPEALSLTSGTSGSVPGLYMWGRGSSHTTYPEGYTGGALKGFYVPERRIVLVFEMQDYVLENTWEVLDDLTGQVMTISDEAYRELRAISKDQGTGIPIGNPIRKRKYRRTFFGGTNFIKQEELPSDRFTYLALTCFQDKKPEGVQWFGLVRPLRDPQRIANKGFSQVVHILSVNPKGVMLHEGDVFEDVRKAEVEWSKPSGRIEVRPGALQDGRIQIIKGEYPSDFERITNFCLNAVPRIAAVDPYMMGQTGGDIRRVSGTALSQVVQQGQMMLSIPFDGLRNYRLDQGRILLSFMSEFLPDESIIRVLGEESATAPQFVTFLRSEADNSDLDVIIGEVPLSPSQQQETWSSLTDSGALKSLLDHEWLDGEDVADLAANWPEEVRERVRKKAREQKQMRQQMMMAQAQGQQQQGPPQGAMPQQ